MKKRKAKQVSEDETCAWCHLGVSPEDEELVHMLDLVFHKRCYEDFKKERLRGFIG